MVVRVHSEGSFFAKCPVSSRCLGWEDRTLRSLHHQMGEGRCTVLWGFVRSLWKRVVPPASPWAGVIPANCTQSHKVFLRGRSGDRGAWWCGGGLVGGRFAVTFIGTCPWMNGVTGAKSSVVVSLPICSVSLVICSSCKSPVALPL